MTIPTDPVAGSVPVGVAVERVSEAVVLVLSGDVDYRTAPTIKATVLTVLGERPALVVIDLLDVDFLGSAGLALLIEAEYRAGHHTVLRVVAAGPRTLRPLQMAGLDGVFSVHPTRHDALTTPTPT